MQNDSVKNRFLIYSCLLIGGWLIVSKAWAAPNQARQDATAPFAVVELFTSEGCSSCPPADNLLRQLTHSARSKNLRIFTVGYHVDYWDYLGWKDKFATSQFSNIQRYYARQFKSTTVYTPQMIVNGESSFGGYRHDLAQQYIDQALSVKPKSRLTFSSVSLNKDRLSFHYSVLNGRKGDILKLLVVERRLFSNVTRGENAGKKLHHDNVVRQLHEIPLKKNEGSFSINLPTGIQSDNTSLIGYVQDSTSLKITGANIVDLDNI